MFNRLCIGENENFDGFSSPYCGSRASKLIVRASSRAGVPVFMRPVSNPSLRRHSVIPCEAASPALPPSACEAPQCIMPSRNVPAVSTAARHENSTPMRVLTPRMRGVSAEVSKSSSVAASCQM